MDLFVFDFNQQMFRKNTGLETLRLARTGGTVPPVRGGDRVFRDLFLECRRKFAYDSHNPRRKYLPLRQNGVLRASPAEEKEASSLKEDVPRPEMAV